MALLRPALSQTTENGNTTNVEGFETVQIRAGTEQVPRACIKSGTATWPRQLFCKLFRNWSCAILKSAALLVRRAKVLCRPNGHDICTARLCELLLHNGMSRFETLIKGLISRRPVCRQPGHLNTVMSKTSTLQAATLSTLRMKGVARERNCPSHSRRDDLLPPTTSNKSSLNRMYVRMLYLFNTCLSHIYHLSHFR